MLVGCSAPLATGVTTPDATPLVGPTLRVLTYNVNFELYHSSTVDAVLAANADVAFLQETTSRWETMFRPAISELYPYVEFRMADPDGGMAILSRLPFHTEDWRPSPVGKFPAWCVRVDTALGELAVLMVHLHPPLDENGLLTGFFTTSDERLIEVRGHLGCFGRPPDLAVGDFNEGEGEALDAVGAVGLTDAALTQLPLARTWEMQVGGQILRGRPDHVFAARRYAPVRVEVLEAGASDHRPLLVTLQQSGL